LVDSASPSPVLDETWTKFRDDPKRLRLYDFGDNVGHLSRKGRDGWGRAFCFGLDYAVEHGYEHVLHIEGDSLLRIPARDIVARLKKSGKGCASITVRGTTRDIPGWVETGLMAFSTAYLRKSRFTEVYDWPVREVRPTPEFVVYRMVLNDMVILDDLKGLRADKNQISAANIRQLDLDWVTHCHNDIDVYAHFVDVNLPHGSFPESRTKEKQTPNVAVVVGGAASVWQEIALTEALLLESGAAAKWFVANDMIARFPHPCTAITLHPQHIGGWVSERTKAGFPKPDQFWAHVKHDNVTHHTEDWRGGSGLFGVAVARKLGFERIILAGVPMSPSWPSCAGLSVEGVRAVPGWLEQRQAEIAPYLEAGQVGPKASDGPLAFLGPGERRLDRLQSRHLTVATPGMAINPKSSSMAT
jgi:hypothetical protein